MGGERSLSISWYVLRSKPRKESSLCQFARSQGHEIFYPEIPAHPVNPRALTVKPYFPGYLFVRTRLREVGESTFRWMPFSQGLVYVGGEPASVPDWVVEAVRWRVVELWSNGHEPPERFRRGERVIIAEGAFAGYEAIFDERLPGKERARILLKMVHDRFVMMEIEEKSLEPVERLRWTGSEA